MIKKELVEKISEFAKKSDELCAGKITMLKQVAIETKSQELLDCITAYAKSHSEDYACGSTLVMVDEESAKKLYEKLLSEIASIDTTVTCAAMKVLPFYGEAETVLGKKEHYQDVTVRFGETTKKLLAGEKDVKSASTLLLALITAIDLMSEQLFEHHMALIDDFKEVFATYKEDFKASEGNTRIKAAYAVNRACDMKVLLAEKYDSYVDELVK